MKLKVRIIILILALAAPITVWAHSGRTDANGCHTNKKTGEYHCHTPKIKTARTEARTESRSDEAVDPICAANIYNCKDFSSHAEAQKVFEACGGINNDIHDLDRDHDGSACESL